MSNQQALHTDHKAPDIFLPACSPYVLRQHKAIKMLQKQITSIIDSRIDEAALLSIFFDKEILQELLKFEQAVVNRVLEQQQSWFIGIFGILQEYNEIKEANTLSKYVEREYNIIGQWIAFIAKQATDWTEMMENIQVDYSYWISQKKFV